MGLTPSSFQCKSLPENSFIILLLSMWSTLQTMAITKLVNPDNTPRPNFLLDLSTPNMVIIITSCQFARQAFFWTVNWLHWSNLWLTHAVCSTLLLRNIFFPIIYHVIICIFKWEKMCENYITDKYSVTHITRAPPWQCQEVCSASSGWEGNYMFCILN